MLWHINYFAGQEIMFLKSIHSFTVFLPHLPLGVKRKVLKTGKRVVIPQSPVKQFPHTHKKPYVLYVKLVPEDVVPSTSCNSKKPHDDSSTK